MSWTHNLAILSRCKRPEEREFSLRLASREQWSSRELERQLQSSLFERAMLSPPKLSPLERELHPGAESSFRDTSLVEFLDLPADHLETDLHKGLLRHMSRFLAELGRDFCFVGSEVPVQVAALFSSDGATSRWICCSSIAG